MAALVSCSGGDSNGGPSLGTAKVSTSYSYSFESNGCKTGQHSFDSEKNYCEALLNEELNNGCAKEMRIERYKRECSATLPVKYLSISESNNLILNQILKQDLNGVKELLYQGIKFSVNKNISPLHDSLMRNNHEISKTLINYVVEEKMLTPVAAYEDFVVRNANFTLMEYMEDVVGVTPRPNHIYFIDAVLKSGNMELVHRAIEMGTIFTDIIDDLFDEMNVFQFTGSYNDKEIFNFLHKGLGVSLLIDVELEIKNNLLHRAPWHVKTIKMARILIDSIIEELEEKGLDKKDYIYRRDTNNLTVLGNAVKAYEENHNQRVAEYIFKRIKKELKD
jgi:hypothetical protein